MPGPVILDGKKTAAAIRAEIAAEVAELTRERGRAPGLAVILAGDDPGSQVYVRMKVRACEETGIISRKYEPGPETAPHELAGIIKELNADPAIDGILVQLPLYPHLPSQEILDMVEPTKDVDGFHPENMGRLALGLPGLRPCTPVGCLELLRRYNITAAGKQAAVVGRSNIVGKPLALLLTLSGDMGNATVTICHSRTRDLAAATSRADLIFAAVGVPHLIGPDHVKEGAVVVDVGINRTDDGLVGDVDFEAVKDKCQAITPVPGGVGPMTIAMLLRNTVEAFKKHP